MARPLRLDVPGAVYHLMARGNERRPVFTDDADRSDYLSRVGRYRGTFGFRIFGFCLITNRIHRAHGRGPFRLSRVMASPHSSCTEWFDRRH